eukprot:TRINITY_DN488_c0_g1_i1.p3 TRINITY_DN488_c0_g1~~TRINITY_DN488_c0_g1_i1.p3  ORF type:complete len:147 (-),score=29.31 TRINITY_DN488_c0_g1_i1:546-935(-)
MAAAGADASRSDEIPITILRRPRQMAEEVRRDPQMLLYACLLVDFIGFCSYLILFLGEFTDICWAPIAGLFLQYMFGSMLVSSLGFIEEILPFTDIVPTATLAWCLANLDCLEGVRAVLGVRKVGGHAA